MIRPRLKTFACRWPAARCLATRLGALCLLPAVSVLAQPAQPFAPPPVSGSNPDGFAAAAPPAAGTPAPGTPTNPSAALSCRMLPESSGNGGSSGPGGVMQLINGPGLATGGAWAPPPNGGRQRTVNFNYNFGNLDRLLGVLNPQPLRRYTVESAVITVFPSEAGGEPHAGDLSAKFHGNARSLNWSDSVTDSSPLAGQAFASRWSIELRLTGQRSGVVTTDSRPFDVRVHCLLPVQQ